MITQAQPQVTRHGLLDMQACVPKDWTDEQATTFANGYNPTGLDHGWEMRKQGGKWLAGADERVPCEERPDHVHISFDC